MYKKSVYAILFLCHASWAIQVAQPSQYPDPQVMPKNVPSTQIRGGASNSADVASPLPSINSSANLKKNSAFEKLKLKLQAKREFSQVKGLEKKIEFHSTDINSAVVASTGIGQDLNEKTVLEWLKSLGFINDRLLQPGCLDVVTLDATGKAAEKVFHVKYNPQCLGLPHSSLNKKNLFLVVKKIKAEIATKEVVKLNWLLNNPKIREISTVRDPNFPQLAFPEGFYRYTDSNNQNIVLSVMHAAKGHELLSYVKKSDNPVIYAEGLEAFNSLGKTLGNFHKKFMQGNNCSILGGDDIGSCQTLIHGDLHPKNVFYDKRYIYFIDLETMQSTDLRSFAQDLAYLYALPVVYWNFRHNPTLHRNYKNFYKAFWKEYAKVVAPNPVVRVQMKRLLQQEIFKYVQKWKNRSQTASVPVRNDLEGIPAMVAQAASDSTNQKRGLGRIA